MSARERGYGADDVDEVELGCAAYSKTHTGRHDHPRGGTVVRIQLDDDDSLLAVTTIEWPRGNNASPDFFDIDRADINLDTVTFISEAARGEIERMTHWLSGRYAPKGPMVKARWYGVIAELAERSVKLWLRGEENRYQADRARKAAAS